MQRELSVDRYRPEDRADLYEVCLRTGDIGADASADYDDPDVLGHVYVGPYLELAPDLAFVLRGNDAGGRPLGYAVATADTPAFEAACERRWWPDLRAHHRAHPPREGSRDAGAVRTIRAGIRTRAVWLEEYPAHLHINLLPQARRSGGGRALIARIASELEARDVPGVHVGVSSANTGAIAFYTRVGFTVLDRHPETVRMGRRLAPAAGAPGGRP